MISAFVVYPQELIQTFCSCKKRKYYFKTVCNHGF